MRWLRQRARSEAEVRAKLTQLGFSQPAIDSALKKLTSLRLLDDESFARNWALSRIEGRGYGPLRVDRELRQKGIAPSVISQILEETFRGEGETRRAKLLLEKKFGHQDLTRPKILRRAINFLQGRGYRDSAIAAIFLQSFDND
ncbi:MAG TPA: regulatory protein RecX [Candidatus Acidoferrales bacterium]|nr:regulatory protein RecX [Candidatus Acidoferrales bacterium]